MEKGSNIDVACSLCVRVHSRAEIPEIESVEGKKFGWQSVCLRKYVKSADFYIH